MAGYIYLIRNGGLHSIGSAENLERRMQKLKPDEVVAVLESKEFESIEKNLHKPLTDVPDPFEKYNSFGEHNNEKLKKFLNNFNFKYNFKSSTQLYKSGFFKDRC